MLPTKLKVSLISCTPLPPSIIANSIHQKDLRSSGKHDSPLKAFGRFKSSLRRGRGKRSLCSTSASFGHTLPDVLRNLMVDARTYDFVCALRALSKTRGMKTFFILLKRIKELRILTRWVIKYEANILIDLSKYAIDHSISSGHFYFNGSFSAPRRCIYGRIWRARG